MSTAVAALAAAGLVIAVLVFVAWPFVVPEREPREPALSELERRRLAAAERRDEAYGALQELEQDTAAGKVSRRGQRARALVGCGPRRPPPCASWTR